MKLIHYSKKPLTSIHSTNQLDKAHNKPHGLWVSVKGDMDWKEWCTSEEFSQDNFECETEITLADKHDILLLDTPHQIDCFHFEHRKLLTPDMPDFWYIDWAHVATIYQGIIIAPYQWSRRLEGDAHNWYYGWDCASGCIWDHTAIKVVEYENTD